MKTNQKLFVQKKLPLIIFRGTFLLFSVSVTLFVNAQNPSSSNTLGSSGRTSIASTTSNDFRLSINGNVKQYGTGDGTGTGSTILTSPTLFLQNTTSTTGRQYLINSNNGGSFRISDVTTSSPYTATDRFLINSLGLIGINNSNPTASLHIKGTGATSSTTSFLIQNSTNNNLVTVLDDGKVGIGTSTPTQTLEIAGNVKITGTNTAPINITNNHYQNPQIQTSNTYNAAGAGTGFAASNNLNHTLQMTMACSDNVYIPDGAWVRASGTGGLSLVVNGGGPIAFTPSLTLGSTSEWGRFSPAGNFGLGEKNPTEKLDVIGNLKFSGALMPSNTAGTSGQVLTSTGSGTAPVWTTPGTGYWAANGNDIYKINSGNVGIGTTTPQYSLDINGTARVIDQLIIGNDTYTFPPEYRLSVKDGIITERLKIRLRANWPDYVFSKGYSLSPLSEIENYIRANKHLPGIQSAEDVKQNGIEIGEMTSTLVQKIEELTIYMIEADKQIQDLKKQVKDLKTKNN